MHPYGSLNGFFTTGTTVPIEFEGRLIGYCSKSAITLQCEYQEHT